MEDDQIPPPKGEPSQEEIRRRCLEIQAGWSEAEEAHRRLWIPHRDPENFGEAEALERATAWYPPGVRRGIKHRAA